MHWKSVTSLYISLYKLSLLNKNEKKMLKNVLVQGPGYTKRPFGHRVAYPYCCTRETLARIAFLEFIFVLINCKTNYFLFPWC